MQNTQKQHIALIIKYTGISFITGGLSHGFFSGERQIITSLVGIGFFIVGTLLEQNSGEKEYLRTIIFSSILAVAIGALTGGLQHFPDSPNRSVWLVPLGFLISAYAYFTLEKKDFFTKKYLIYTLFGFVFFVCISGGFYGLIQAGYFGGAGGGGHDHGAGGHSNTIEDTRDLKENSGFPEAVNPNSFNTDIEKDFIGDGHVDHDH